MGNLHLYIVTVFSCLFLLSCSSDSSTTYYSLTVTPTPAEGGTVSPSGGEFEAGQEVELSVKPMRTGGLTAGMVIILGPDLPQLLSWILTNLLALCLSNKIIRSLFILKERAGSSKKWLHQRQITLAVQP